MIILSFKEGHDGAVAAIEDGRVLFSIEAEKDSWGRYANLTGEAVVEAASRLPRPPDVVVLSGWVKGFQTTDQPSRTGYFGVGAGSVSDEPLNFLGTEVRLFSSSHERSHIMTAYGLAESMGGRDCYSLVWEGNIGSFYRIDEAGGIEHLGECVPFPGNKYSFLFALADPGFHPQQEFMRFQDAGKQMALAAFGADREPLNEERVVIESILDHPTVLTGGDTLRPEYAAFHDIGVESQRFKDLARQFSLALFGRFRDWAETHLRERLPLLVSGGCGLNCDWNRAWAESGLFSEVFVPPCPNDSGSALGSAIDAQHHYTGDAGVQWDVYAGSEFIQDVKFDDTLDVRPLDMNEVAGFIEDGGIIGWARGRWEIGPRALGNRSILAAPFSERTRDRLNAVKQRENYRPIAPICLEEDAEKWFDGPLPNPYMLYFGKVLDDELRAVTHVDGTARVQTVNTEQNSGIAELLAAFRTRTGYSVLCNTSLNFSGRGFINRTSDLLEYGAQHGLDGYVIGDLFVRPVRRDP